jgi:hypothetical protein
MPPLQIVYQGIIQTRKPRPVNAPMKKTCFPHHLPCRLAAPNFAPNENIAPLCSFLQVWSRSDGSIFNTIPIIGILHASSAKKRREFHE